MSVNEEIRGVTICGVTDRNYAIDAKRESAWAREESVRINRFQMRD